MADKKTCYIIGQIGKPETEERKWADFVREHIVECVVMDCGYQVPARADDPYKEMIMPDIIEQMFEAELVIADLTNYNPNVFYELGIRHCAEKPAIHLIKIGQSPPFDLGGNKAIFIDRDHEKVIAAKSEIKKRIKAIEDNPKQFFSQVQQHIQYKELELFKKSKRGEEKVFIDALTTLVQSIGLHTELIRDLHEQLVVKPRKELGGGGIEAYEKALLRKALLRKAFLPEETKEVPPQQPKDEKNNK